MSRPFKHFGALRSGNGFGIAVDDLSTDETSKIAARLRDLKRNIRGVKMHPNFYPRGDKMISAWVIPAEREAIEPMLEIIEEYGFKRNASADRLIEQILQAEEERQKQQEENQELSVAQEGPDIIVPGLAGSLRNYQKAAVDWIVRNRRVYIGDEMGTGKTLCALAAVAVEQAYPVVVICPASIKMGWVRQINRFFPSISNDLIFVCSGRTSKRIPGNTKIVIINYDILAGWVAEIQRLRCKAVVFDEAHFIKNGKSKRAKASAILASQIEIRIAMSGTPLTNSPIDLMSQLSIIGRLNEITGGRNWTFVERYCNPSYNGYGWDTRGASNLFELNTRLRRSGILIRRRKEDVLTELPPKERISIPLEITNRPEYNRVRDDIAVWIRSQVNSDQKFNEHLSTLTPVEAQNAWQHEVDAKVARAKAAIAITKLNALRQVCARGKINAALEWIDDFLTSDEKLVLFCSHRNTVDMVCKHLGPKAVRVVGGMGSDARQAAIDRFSEDDSVRVVVANIDAAAEGIDGWQHVCSNVAFLELTWTPTKHHQAEDRCHRSGQENPVSCYYLMAAGTIDEYLAELIDHKRAIISAVVDGTQKDEEHILSDLLNRLSMGEF